MGEVIKEEGGSACAGAIFSDNYPSNVTRAMEKCCAGNITVVGSFDGVPAGHCAQYCHQALPWPEDAYERADALWTWSKCVEEFNLYREDFWAGLGDMQCFSLPQYWLPPDFDQEAYTEEREREDEEGAGTRLSVIMWTWSVALGGLLAQVVL